MAQVTDQNPTTDQGNGQNAGRSGSGSGENVSGTTKTARITERSLFHWAYRGNLALQLLLLLLIVLVVFARVLPLEMQKRIVNDAIALQKLDSLLEYCAIYIAALTAAGLLKLMINSIQAIIGERVIMAMRHALYQHIISLPLGFFRTTQPGMIVTSLMNELSTAGNFAGMAFAVPLTNILTLLAFAGYLLWLNVKLAVATLLIYPVVVFVLPSLQKHANKANKTRVDLSRSTSSHIAESISGINEIQAHGSYRLESTKFNRLAEQLKKIRIRWSLFRYSIKTANNYFIGLGPFIVFVYGGYLIMHGQLELGAMIAFLTAQEKLFDPWKELIEFYQTYQDARVSYDRTMEAYNIDPDFSLEEPKQQGEPLRGEIVVRDLSYVTAEGTQLLDKVSFSLTAGEHLAVVGYSGGGKTTLVQCIAKMFPYSSGSILLDNRELDSISKRELSREVGYISQQPFIFTGTLAENLCYALNATHPGTESDNGENPPDSQSAQSESKDVTAPYSGEELDRMIQVVQQSGLFVDVMRFGLDSVLSEDDTATADGIVRIRRLFKRQFGEKLADSIEFYDPEKYHRNSTVAENIIFGTVFKVKLIDHLHGLPMAGARFREFLRATELEDELLQLGTTLARSAVDLFSGIGTVDLFFRNSPLPMERLPECEAIVRRLDGKKTGLNDEEVGFLIALALNFSPALHTMYRLSNDLETRIIAARHVFASSIALNESEHFAPYSSESYIHGQSILNNIIFGKIHLVLPSSQETINQSIIQLLVEEDFLEKIAAIGMQFQVGSMGDRLSGGQRQKLAIARVLLKQPKIIIMDEATSALDNKSQARIQGLLTGRWRGRRTVLGIVHRLDTVTTFDKIAVMKGGKLVEFGSYRQLLDQQGIFYELMYGKK